MKSKLVENDLSSKDSSLWSRYCWYLAASIAVVAVAFSGTELHALDRFGETFTSKLCEILPPPPKKVNCLILRFWEGLSNGLILRQLGVWFLILDSYCSGNYYGKRTRGRRGI